MCLIFYFMFTVSVPPPINRPQFPSDFTIHILSSISSFEMNKVNLFPTLMDPHPLIFSFKFITDKVALFANSGKTSSAKGTVRSVNAFLPKLVIILLRNPPD